MSQVGWDDGESWGLEDGNVPLVLGLWIGVGRLKRGERGMSKGLSFHDEGEPKTTKRAAGYLIVFFWHLRKE